MPSPTFEYSSISSQHKQEQIGDVIGVSFQQIDRLEKGQQRLSPANLYKLSIFFDVSPASFFNQLHDIDPSNPVNAASLSHRALRLGLLFDSMPGSIKDEVAKLIKTLSERTVDDE